MIGFQWAHLLTSFHYALGGLWWWSRECFSSFSYKARVLQIRVLPLYSHLILNISTKERPYLQIQPLWRLSLTYEFGCGGEGDNLVQNNVQDWTHQFHTKIWSISYVLNFSELHQRWYNAEIKKWVLESVFLGSNPGSYLLLTKLPLGLIFFFIHEWDYFIISVL